VPTPVYFTRTSSASPRSFAGFAASLAFVGVADFDPTGTRIVIAAYARIGAIDGSALNLVDLNGGGLYRVLAAG